MILIQNRTHKPSWFVKHLKEIEDLKRHEYPCLGKLIEVPIPETSDSYIMTLRCARCGEEIASE